MRVDGRQNDQLREIKFELGFVKNSLGSALSACGLTEDKAEPSEFLTNPSSNLITLNWSF